MARSYELAVIINPETGDEQAEALKSQVRTLVTDGGGEITGEDDWGRRKLAYPIGKHSEGNYFLTRFSLDAVPAKQLEGTLNLAEDVIRYLLVLQSSKASA